MSDVQRRPAPARWGRAAWGGLLSLATPGLGHVHARSWRLGLGLFVIAQLVGMALRGLTWLQPDPVVVGLVMGGGVAGMVLSAGIAIDAVRRLLSPTAPARPRWFRSTWFTAILLIAISAGINEAMPIRWKTFSIPSGSNIPALWVGEVLVADTSGGDVLPARGDMIVFLLPGDPSLTYVKRVVGLPGDRVQMKRGRLFLNGEIVARAPAGTFVASDDAGSILLRRYIETLPGGRSYAVLKASDSGPLDDTAEYRVPDGKLFTLGDNRDNSLDSRDLAAVGYVPRENVVGRARTILWSATRARIISRID